MTKKKTEELKRTEAQYSWQKRFEWLAFKIQEISEEVEFGRHLEPGVIKMNKDADEGCLDIGEEFFISMDLDGVCASEEVAKKLWGDRYIRTIRVSRTRLWENEEGEPIE